MSPTLNRLRPKRAMTPPRSRESWRGPSLGPQPQRRVLTGGAGLSPPPLHPRMARLPPPLPTHPDLPSWHSSVGLPSPDGCEEQLWVCVCVCACVCVHATLEENVSTLGRILAWHPSKLPFFRYEVNMYLEERVAGTFL